MARIVVLDDQSDVCECISMRLSANGHDVRTTHTGDEAIDLGYLFQPDILIVDWYLKSEYDGLEVAEAYTVASKNAKTILITGQSIVKAEEHAAASQIFKAVAKPFSLDDLSDIVDEALQDHENTGVFS